MIRDLAEVKVFQNTQRERWGNLENYLKDLENRFSELDKKVGNTLERVSEKPLPPPRADSSVLVEALEGRVKRLESEAARRRDSDRQLEAFSENVTGLVDQTEIFREDLRVINRETRGLGESFKGEIQQLKADVHKALQRVGLSVQQLKVLTI